MALRTTVKVGQITNLSDARYCAGMGVDMLGFSVIEGQEHYVNPVQFQEIRGWFAGPQVVAELYGLTSSDQLESILRNYQPDKLEVSYPELHLLNSIDLPLLVSLSERECEQVLPHKTHPIQTVIVPANLDSQSIRKLSKVYSVFLRIQNLMAPEMLELPISGVVLVGSSEERPGLKDYSFLANILETLEID